MPETQIVKATRSPLASEHFDAQPTGLIVTGCPPLDEWQALGKFLIRVDGTMQWLIGDWLKYGDEVYKQQYGKTRWGEMYDDATDETGLSASTLKRCKSLANKFQLAHRCANLTWKHHLVVQALPLKTALRWLALAEKNGWSAAKLRAMLKASQETEEADADAIQPEVYMEDCEAFLGRFEPDSVDLLLTDPPYMTDVEDVRAFAQAWLPDALAKVKPSGRAYVCIGAYPDEIAAYLDVPRQGMTLANILVWTYRNTLGPSPRDDYKLNWQAILYLRGPDAPPLNCPVMLEQFAVQDINAPDGRQGDRLHKWQKPVKLAERFVRHSTRPGETVIDPYVGTGTFVVAAGLLGRQAFGADKDAEQIAIAKTRGCKYED